MDNYNFIVGFIKIVEQHPVLYDPKLPDRTPQLCSITWEKVGEQVKNELHEEFTAEELKTKWKGIRSSFARFKRKAEKSRDKESTKQYYLYETLKFLNPYSKNKRRYSEERNDEQSSEADDWESEAVNIFNNDVIDHTNSNTSDSLAVHSNNLVYAEVKVEPRENVHAVDTTNVISDFLPDRDTLKRKRASSTYEATPSKSQIVEENADLQFFRSILPDIEHFTKSERRKFKIGVLKLIDEIENSRPDVR